MVVELVVIFVEETLFYKKNQYDFLPLHTALIVNVLEFSRFIVNMYF